MKKVARKNRQSSRKLLAGLIIVVVMTIVAGTVWATNHYHHNPTPSNTTSQSPPTPRPVATKGNGTTTTSPSPTPSTGTQGSSPATPPPSTSPSVKPAAPYGTFVSNHFPGQHGSPADTESSECVTTPAVSCSISFSKDGVTKSLPAETTDSDGAAYWATWSISQLGLTSGNWTVSATATSGNQTTTTTDRTALQVP